MKFYIIIIIKIYQFDIDLIYINPSVIIPASGGSYPRRLKIV